MKILSAEQIRAWDAATIQAQELSSLQLMERAAGACVDWIEAHFTAATPFLVVCGTGNNGGDGLAIARLLYTKGYAVMAMLVRHTDALSPDCAENLSALDTAGVKAGMLGQGDFITELPAEIVVLDALFGTGLNRQPEGYVADFITTLNRLPNKKIAIDLPSGMSADHLPEEGAVMLQAHYTLCFQQYKRAMLHPEGGAACGEIHLIDIGLDASFAAAAEGHWHTLDKDLVQSIYRPRKSFTHKGTHGTAYIVGGSYGLIGAALLATQAAGRAGAGKVRALVPEFGYNIIQSGAPEAMCRTSGAHFLEAIEGWESAKGIGVGPGMGTEPQTIAAFKSFMEKIDRSIVLDADALNLLGENPELMEMVPPQSILTPHPKELERMFGKTTDSYERAALARQRAMRHQVVIISKDTYSMIALPDGRCFYKTNGNAGLGTGGSGDVLCGIIAGLLAQGYPSEDAAMLGTYLHSAAGDAALGKTGREAMVAGDIVAGIGPAFLSLQKM